jgi:hypothetical protein
MNGPNRRRLARRLFRASLAAGQSRKISSTGSLSDPQSEYGVLLRLVQPCGLKPRNHQELNLLRPLPAVGERFADSVKSVSSVH